MTSGSNRLGIAIMVCLMAISAALWAWLPAKRGSAQRIGPITLTPLPPQPEHFWLHGPRWIAFAPSRQPTEASSSGQDPAELSLREDLMVLRKAGFNGLITYSANNPAITRLAVEEGFTAVLIGIWNPAKAEEIERAINAASHPIVRGLIVGNEGLMDRRYDLTTLTNAISQVRAAAGKPVSTTEIVNRYYTQPDLIAACDFLAPNAHPYFNGHRRSRSAAEWTVQAYLRLVRQAAPKPVLLKEVGLPTAGEPGLSEQEQAEYYVLLQQSEARFACFEAFDQPHKDHLPIEPHWGLFHSDRTPKEVMRRLAPAAFPARGAPPTD